MSKGADNASEGTANLLLDTLICFLREKNVLSRADLQELRDQVQARSCDSGLHARSTEAILAAGEDMRRLELHCGMKFGGKHRKHQ